MGLQSQVEPGRLSRVIQIQTVCNRISAEVRCRLFSSADQSVLIKRTRMHLWQVDVSTAFLYGNLPRNETVSPWNQVQEETSQPCF